MREPDGAQTSRDRRERETEQPCSSPDPDPPTLLKEMGKGRATVRSQDWAEPGPQWVTLGSHKSRWWEEN